MTSQPSVPFNAEDSKSETILRTVADQLNKLIQVHRLTEAAATLPEAPPALENAEAAKQKAIANLFMLLTAYCQSQGWNPQEIRALILDVLERYQPNQPGQ